MEKNWKFSELYEKRIWRHHLIPNYVISYHVISYHVIPYHIMLYHIMLYHIVSYHIISCYLISCYIISCYIIIFCFVSLSIFRCPVQFSWDSSPLHVFRTFVMSWQYSLLFVHILHIGNLNNMHLSVYFSFIIINFIFCIYELHILWIYFCTYFLQLSESLIF